MIAMAVTASTCSIPVSNVMRAGLLPEPRQLVGIELMVEVMFSRPFGDILTYRIVLGGVIRRDQDAADCRFEFREWSPSCRHPHGARPRRFSALHAVVAAKRIAIDSGQHVHGVDHGLPGHVREGPFLQTTGAAWAGIVRSAVSLGEIGQRRS
jgi:hypothetical protein